MKLAEPMKFMIRMCQGVDKNKNQETEAEEVMCLDEELKARTISARKELEKKRQDESDRHSSSQEIRIKAVIDSMPETCRKQADAGKNYAEVMQLHYGDFSHDKEEFQGSHYADLRNLTEAARRVAEHCRQKGFEVFIGFSDTGKRGGERHCLCIRW